MKIAIFHNYLDNIGGAEIVALSLAKGLKADLYTTNLDLNKIRKMGFKKINLYSIGKIPINPPFRQQLALNKFKKFKLDNYDFFIIAGDWALSGGMNNKPNLWYAHSPIREIWDLYEYTRDNIVPFGKKFAFSLWVKYNRQLSRRYIKGVNKIVCNSNNTKERIKKYLGREAMVIHPPVDTSRFKYEAPEDYWLSVNRLVNHKRIELQLNAFSKLPNEKLVIVGCSEKAKHFIEYANYIDKIKPSNVKIVKGLSSDELIKLYSRCKGLIATGYNEDFGLTPIEAMSSGKPVIAVNEGGYKETVIDKVTGRLIEVNENKLISAIKETGKNPESYKKECIKQSKQFDVKHFIEEIKKEVQLGQDIERKVN